MRLAFLILAGVMWSGAANADLFDDIDAAIKGRTITVSGQSVLDDARSGDASMLNLLGRYLQNGERGFPVDLSLAEKAYKLAYERGDWMAAYPLGEILVERRNDTDQAFLYYSLAYLAGRHYEATHVSDDWSPTISHLAYARIREITDVSKIDLGAMKAARCEAFKQGRIRGFFDYEVPPECP